MAVGGYGESRNLEDTPTWAVAAVCTVFVTVSLLLEFIIEKVESFLTRAHRKHLVLALRRMKDELTVMGFISLLLTVFQYYVASICVQTSYLKHWTPCRVENTEGPTAAESPEGGARRRLLATATSSPMFSESLYRGRILAAYAPSSCKTGYLPLLSTETLHDLHIIIFVLAVVHIIYSLFAMLLASTKVNGWKIWEDEAHRDTSDNLTEVVKSLSLHRQTTFIKEHTSKVWNRNWFTSWIICFFRQFGSSVARSDYLALRQGFITTHKTGPGYDFHSYILRSLEDEYQKVVGISPFLWLLVIFFMLFSIAGTNLFFWLSTVPAVLLLVVGAKLQRVIASLALDSAGFARSGLQAAGTLKPRDSLFWFNRPEWILSLFHYILFQNAFVMATFLAYAWMFGWRSCLLTNKGYVYARLAIGGVVLIVCSYSTLPLYALVTQMGSHYKRALFQDHVREEIRQRKFNATNTATNGTSAAGEELGGFNGTRHLPSYPSDLASNSTSNSSAQVGLTTISVSRNVAGFELRPPVEKLLHHSQADPRHQSQQSGLEISMGSEKDSPTFLIPQSQSRTHVRAKSEIRPPTQHPFSPAPHKVSNRYYKQLSSDTNEL